MVFLVQNNGYAISVPLAKQTAAPSLAHQGVGYGMPVAAGRRQRRGRRATRCVARRVGPRPRGGGPTLIEALTYRIEAHTNADDATRYRHDAEVAAWLARDPIARLRDATCGPAACWTTTRAARRRATRPRTSRPPSASGMNADPTLDPAELFAHVYARADRGARRAAGRPLAELEAELAS